jgi:hypothetical protein
MLFKSSLLRDSGPECLYDALAQCSEALELCNQLTKLQHLLPKVQFYRGVCFYQLNLMSQALAAFRAVDPDTLFGDSIQRYLRTLGEAVDASYAVKRRPGFDENRVPNCVAVGAGTEQRQVSDPFPSSNRRI